MNYRPDIQGLRAIAVLAIILFHFNPAWLPGGFVGVDVFLVLSGYLIVSILLEKKAQPHHRLSTTLSHFYIGRFKRIAPAYFVMLVLVSLTATVFFIPPDLSIYNKGLRQAVWFHSNNYFAGFGDYFSPGTYEQPLLHTWSLAVEIQFYLLAPLLVLLLPTKSLKWLFVALLVILTAITEYRLRALGIHQASYYSLHARLPEFFAGGLAALLTRSSEGRSPWLSCLGLALVLASAATQPLIGPFPGVAAILPVAGAALILRNPAQGLAGRLLSNKPMEWLGKLSYSLYLWHWPVLALLRYYTGSQVLDIPFSLLFITLTLLLAISSFYWVETPLRAQRTRIRQVLAFSSLAGAVLVSSPSIREISLALLPPQLPAEYQRYADPTTICHGQIVGDCIKGNLNSSKEVLVLGDSHAAMLNLFFDQLGQELDFKARIITASSCVTIPGFDYQRLPEWAHNPCQEQIEQAKKYLPNAAMVFLAANWNWQLASDDFNTALNTFLSDQSHKGIKVFILEQVPLLSHNPLRVIRFKSLGLETKTGTDPAYQRTNATMQHIVGSHSGVSSLNFEVSGLFADAPFIKGVPIYYDKHHLNEIGAKRYATVAHSAFKDILD